MFDNQPHILLFVVLCDRNIGTALFEIDDFLRSEFLSLERKVQLR